MCIRGSYSMPAMTWWRCTPYSNPPNTLLTFYHLHRPKLAVLPEHFRSASKNNGIYYFWIKDRCRGSSFISPLLAVHGSSIKEISVAGGRTLSSNHYFKSAGHLRNILVADLFMTTGRVHFRVSEMHVKKKKTWHRMTSGWTCIFNSVIVVWKFVWMGNHIDSLQV